MLYFLKTIKVIPMSNIVPVERIERTILLIRGQKVMLDVDLAYLYGVPTKVFNQAVKRNKKRFPENFMFQLTKEEKEELVTNCDRFNRLKHSSSLPFVFTEHGALMSANVLNSEKAVDVSILVVEAFVRLRQMATTHKELSRKVDELEGRIDSQDENIKIVFKTLRQLMAPPPLPPKRKIGFHQ